MHKPYLLLLIFSLFSSHVSYGEQIKVVTEYLEPYQIRNADGSLGGYMTEIIRTLFRMTGDVPDITILPWARAYQIAKSEKNVLIYSIVHTKERSPHFHWIGKIATTKVFFWGLTSRFPQQLDGIDALRQYQIAVLRASNIASYLSAHQFNKLHPLTLEEKLLKMLSRKRIDLIVGTEESIIKRANKIGFNLSKITKVAEIKDLNTHLSIAFNINSSPKLVTRFTPAFTQLEKSGALEAIIRQKLTH